MAHYPYTEVLGDDLYGHLSKGQLASLVVDLLREQLGEDVDAEVLHVTIAQRLDILHAAKIVPSTLPRNRYPRDLG